MHAFHATYVGMPPSPPMLTHYPRYTSFRPPTPAHYTSWHATNATHATRLSTLTCHPHHPRWFVVGTYGTFFLKLNMAISFWRAILFLLFINLQNILNMKKKMSFEKRSIIQRWIMDFFDSFWIESLKISLAMWEVGLFLQTNAVFLLVISTSCQLLRCFSR